MIKRILLEVMIILMIAIPMAFAVNWLRPKGIDILAQHTGNKTAEEITLDDALQAFQKGGTIFIDSRPSADFQKGHIKNAINLPEEEYDQWINSFMSKTDLRTPIITYCDGIECPLAKHLAEDLVQAGFVNVYYLINGWSNWRDHSLPIAAEPYP